MSDPRKGSIFKRNGPEELDGLTSPAALEEFAKKNPGTIQAKIATLEIARIHLGPEGIDKMFVKASDLQSPSAMEAEQKARGIRDAAVKNVEQSREEFAKLVDEFKDSPVIRSWSALLAWRGEGRGGAGRHPEGRADPRPC